MSRSIHRSKTASSPVNSRRVTRCRPSGHWPRICDRVPGKGCYVAEKNLELVREAHLKQIEEHMTEIVTLAAGCSLSEEDTVRMLRLIWENEGKDDTF